MDNNRTKYVLLGMWLLGFLFCLVVTLLAYHDSPKNFGNLLNQVVDTFSPQLATMLAFMFAEQFTEGARQTKKATIILAVVVSGIYVLLFCGIMLWFQLEKLDAKETSDLFSLIRPKTSFLVTAVIAYFFAAKKTEH